jgi:SulP family sulfate permease
VRVLSTVRATAGKDLAAAFVVVVMLVPQSLAYAQLAGMPLQAGLYASVLPMIAYAVFGSSSTLSVGPVAVMSLMTAATLANIAPAGDPQYFVLAASLALLSGLFLFAGGLLKLGLVANLMSHPVVAGFMTGAAVLIILGQIKTLLGMEGHGETAVLLAVSLVENRGTVQGPTALMGLIVLALLWSTPRALVVLGRRFGVALAVIDLARRLTPVGLVVCAIFFTALFALDSRYAIPVVGAIPGGMPGLTVPMPAPEAFAKLLLPALSLALIGFVESVSVAQSLALRRGERISPDAELRGLGAANIAAGLSAGFPVAGGLSRSIVNFSAGAGSRLAGVYAGLLMLIVVQFMTKAFASLPNTVLAAAIILPASGLIDLHVLQQAWRYSRTDAWAYIGTAVGVLVLGIELGILCGVLFSVAAIVWQASAPHIAVLGRVPGTTNYRNQVNAEVITYPHILALRIDADLFFANARAVEQRLEQEVSARAEARHLILNLSAVNQIDLTGLEGLRELNATLRARGVTLHLAEVKGPVLEKLKQSVLIDELARKPFRFMHDAFVGLNAGG